MTKLRFYRGAAVLLPRLNVLLTAGVLLSSPVTRAVGQMAPSGRPAPERVGIPLKFGTLDKVNSTLLGGPSVALQVERTGDAADPLRLRVIMRSLPDKGQANAPAATFSVEADAAIIYQAGPVSGARQLDDPNSQSPVATDVYVLPLSKREVSTLLNATSLTVRARGKKVDVESKRLEQLRGSLEALVAAADAGVPVSATAVETSETVRQVVASSGSAGAYQSSTVVVLQSKIIGGAATATAKADSGVRRVPATATCGTARLCAQGWDLRISRFALDDSVFAPNGFLQGRISVENRGAQKSDLSELRLCVASGAQCIGEAATVAIPALLSGERLEMSQPIPSYSGNDVAPPFSVVATIDPDRATAETNRTNNEAVIRSVTLDTASMAIDNFDVPQALRAGATQLLISLTVRNASRAASMPARAIQLSGYCSYRQWGDVATRVQVPALGPLQTWTASVAVRDKLAVGGGSGCTVAASPLNSTRPDERENEQARMTRHYTVAKP